MSFIQMVLLAAACAFCRMEGGWFGECKLRQPICTSFFVGLILGNIPEALKIGAQFEMIWMGTAGIGPVAHLDVTTGGFLGTVVALVSGKGFEAAMLFALPASMIMQFAESLWNTAFGYFDVKIDNDVANGVYNKVFSTFMIAAVLRVLVEFAVVLAWLLAAGAFSEAMSVEFPAWLENGLGGAGQLLNSYGFAMLLSIMMDTELIPFFMIGYTLAAFADTPYNMIGIGVIGLALAWIYFIIANKFGGKQTVAAAADEWAD